MSKGIRKFIEQIRSYDESRRKRVVVIAAGIVFVVVCMVWVVVSFSGFTDFSGRWISGTRIYTASGTETYDDGSVSSLRSSWDVTRERVGSAWEALTNAFAEATTSSTTPTTATTTNNTSSSTLPL